MPFFLYTSVHGNTLLCSVVHFDMKITVCSFLCSFLVFWRSFKINLITPANPWPSCFNVIAIPVGYPEAWSRYSHAFHIIKSWQIFWTCQTLGIIGASVFSCWKTVHVWRALLFYPSMSELPLFLIIPRYKFPWAFSCLWKYLPKQCGSSRT